MLRRKERGQAHLFLAEGPQAVREAVARPDVVTDVFVSAAASIRYRDMVATAAQQVRAWELSERDIATLSGTVSPQGIVAICRNVDVPLESAVVPGARLVVVCAQVRDPGNAGTVIRCADAFGADAVVLSHSSVDAFNAKTVRASAGSIFHLPLVVEADLVEALNHCRTLGMQVLAADGAGDTRLTELSARGELARPTAWLMGNEAWGLPGEHAALADRVVSVPIYGVADSLNLSTAAAVCLYASATAQRETAPARRNQVADGPADFLD